MQYSKELASLIEFFQKFPGVGPKSAQRMAFHLLKMSGDEVQKFANVMVEAKENIKYCDICFNMSSSNPCEICSATNRTKDTICVVAQTKDLIAIEKTTVHICNITSIKRWYKCYRLTALKCTIHICNI